MRISEIVLNEGLESNVDCIKAWYDSNNNKLHLLDEGDHHTTWLWKHPDQSGVENISGKTVQEYLDHYKGVPPDIYDEVLIHKYIDLGWVRLAYDYEVPNNKYFLVHGLNNDVASKAFRTFYRYVENKVDDVGSTLELELITDGSLPYHRLTDKRFYSYLKTGVIPRNTMAMESNDPLVEMALPTESIRSKVYYHGTSSEIAAKKIIKQGIQPPDLYIDGKKKNDHLTPVEGKVYLTPRLDYALIYAVGGGFVGLDSFKVPYKGNEERFDRIISSDPTSKFYGRYGYIFVVDGSDLIDVQPDEDEIGNYLTQILTNGSTLPYMKVGEREMYQKALDDPILKSRMAHLARSLSNSTLKRVQNGEMSWQAKAGKAIAKKMDDWMKTRMVELGFHVAHTGAIMPAQVWKFDKTKIGYITADNFFTIGKRVR